MARLPKETDFSLKATCRDILKREAGSCFVESIMTVASALKQQKCNLL
jgi:hypothetical protein